MILTECLECLVVKFFKKLFSNEHDANMYDYSVT